MEISRILILSGSLVLWAIGIGTVAVLSSNTAMARGLDSDTADAVAGVVILVYLAVSAIGLGLLL